MAHSSPKALLYYPYVTYWHLQRWRNLANSSQSSELLYSMTLWVSCFCNVRQGWWILSELAWLKRWRVQRRLSKAYVQSGFRQVRGSNCCWHAYAWHCGKLSAYQLLLPFNPAVAPVCCMAMGSADTQRRARNRAGLDLGSVREKIKEQPHCLLWLQRQKKEKHTLPCSDSHHPAAEKCAFLLQGKPLSSAI